MGKSVSLTVKTERPRYTTGDQITITGQLDATNINQPLLLGVFDEQGNRHRTDNVTVAADGSYSYSFTAGGLMNTNGTYTVMVNYKTTSEKTTFDFVSTDAGPGTGRRPIQVNINGTNHQIQYMITGTGNRLVSVTGDVETISLVARLVTESDGTLSLKFSQDIFDADDQFVAFVDAMPFEGDLPANKGVTNEIHIGFGVGTKEIEILGDFIIPEFGVKRSHTMNKSFSIEDKTKIITNNSKRKKTSTPIRGTTIAKNYKHKVFIVHGHDDTTNLQLARFLKKIGLEPIILGEEVNEGKTIIEKLEKYSKRVHYAFILLTRDDKGGKDKRRLKPRARQNVILELGFFIGRLGRKRVCCLCQERVDLPSDLDGMLTLRFEKNLTRCRRDIVREIRQAGYKVKFNKGR